jgi:very-short-patch-repair endonuclease
MLIENQTTEMTWNNRSKERYIALGYKFTNIGDKFTIDVKDLSPNSHYVVKVKCDFCGCIIEKKMQTYILQHHPKYGDCCAKCQPQKNKLVCMDKYGVDNGSKTQETINKIKQTCIDKYGVDNPARIDGVGEKISKKVKEICKSEEYIEKRKKTNRERYGFDSPMQSPEIRKKISRTLRNNGSCPTSKQQLYICDLLKEIYGNCELNKMAYGFSLDCFIEVEGIKIDVEYDGWYWHKNRREQDKRKNDFLIDRGYRVLRIRANRKAPTKEQIIKAVDYLVKDNHHLAYIDLDIDI